MASASYRIDKSLELWIPHKLKPPWKLASMPNRLLYQLSGISLEKVRHHSAWHVRRDLRRPGPCLTLNQAIVSIDHGLWFEYGRLGGPPMEDEDVDD